MKFFSIILLFSFLNTFVIAQHISRNDLISLNIAQDTLKKPALQILQEEKFQDRLKADSIFTRLFVHALKTRNSFYYSFDSLETISKLYAPDSTFRIFTWQLVVADNLVWQHGAIQMRTADGSLKLFPLIDKSDVTKDYEDSIGNNFGWMGAVYYRIIVTKNSGHTFYTLLGYDENNMLSSRKVIEVLSFVNDKPLFGGPYFSIPNDKLVPRSPARYVMEFKKDASPRLTYDEDLHMIIMEHLVSQTNQPNNKFTLIGDGDYEGFKWNKGKWIYVNKVFNETTPEGKAPVPHPVTEDKRINESGSPMKAPE